MTNKKVDKNLNSREILFIEDNEEHKAYAESVLAKRGNSPLDLRVTYATTRQEAMNYSIRTN